MHSITVYTTEPCSFCTRVKGLLKAHGVEFAEVNLSKDPAGRVELAKRTGMMSFPQVIIGGELLGGFYDPEELGHDVAARLRLAGAGELLQRAEEMASVGNA